MRPANERWHYSVTPSLIGWPHTLNDPCSDYQFHGDTGWQAALHAISWHDNDVRTYEAVRSHVICTLLPGVTIETEKKSIFIKFPMLKSEGGGKFIGEMEDCTKLQRLPLELNCLTHCGLVMANSVRDLGHQWLVACLVTHHYLKQCWLTVNWALRNFCEILIKIQSCLFKKNPLKNVTCNMATILFQPSQLTNFNYLELSGLIARDFTEVCSWGSNCQQANVGLDNGLAPNRWPSLILNE